MNRPQDVYRQVALPEIWRLASMLDRNPYSRTRGSFSRAHWAWKFEDFPFPRLQEGVYSLCRLHDLPGDDNPFHQSPAVAQWIAWGFEYWLSLQNDNGSFDEAYPFEQCLAATAFSSFYLGWAYTLWRNRLPEAVDLSLLRAFQRSADWLCSNDETHGILSNHLAVAAAALELMARICGQEDFSARARFFLNRILENQSPEGWLKEYDGMDIGYGTHGFFYLAVYWQMTSCGRTLTALRKFARYLTYFVHPDGTVGGEYGSRNTEFFFPAGFEILATQCPASAAIADYMRGSLAHRRVCGVWSMDVFNLMPMLNNMFFAMDSASALEDVAPLPWQSGPFEKYFDHSGVWVINRPNYYAIIGLSKGATVLVFDKTRRRLSARHAGLICKWRRRLYTSQDYVLSPAVEWTDNRETATIAVAWRNLNLSVFTPPLFLAFRLFTLTIGRFPAISRYLKILLVRKLIRPNNRPPIGHTRRVHLTAGGVEILDRISLPRGAKSLQALAQFTSIHMGSSMYCDSRAPLASTEVFEFNGGVDRVSLCGQMEVNGTRWREREQ